MEKFIKSSLEKLGLDYLDMYLVHMPFAFKMDEKTCVAATRADGSYVLDLDTDPVSVWKVRKSIARRIVAILVSRYKKDSCDGLSRRKWRSK